MPNIENRFHIMREPFCRSSTQNLHSCGIGPVRETQDGLRKSTCDFEEVGTVGCGVCGARGVLCQVKDDLKWGEEPFMNVRDHRGEGLTFKQVRECAVEV